MYLSSTNCMDKSSKSTYDATFDYDRTAYRSCTHDRSTAVVTLLCNRAYCNRTRITARPELHHPSTTPSGARFQRRSIASLLDLATPIATSLRHNSLLSHARQEAIQQEHVRPGELTCNVQEFVLCRESSRQPANRRPLVFVLAPTDAYEVLEPV